jgi:hypothetical protein
MGLGRTPRKTSIILHVWIVEGVMDGRYSSAKVNDIVVSSTLPHVDDLVVIRRTKKLIY